jgi:hypothetical protein
MERDMLSPIAMALSVAAVVLSPASLLADRKEMEIIIDDRAIVFANITETAAKELAKANGFDNPSTWPVLRTTGHPSYTLPRGITSRAKTHPEWQINRLDEARVAFKDFRGQRVVLLYRQETSILIVLYERMR